MFPKASRLVQPVPIQLSSKIKLLQTKKVFIWVKDKGPEQKVLISELIKCESGRERGKTGGTQQSE